jgi:hypothetical protein
MAIGYFSNNEPTSIEEYITVYFSVYTSYEEGEPISISRFREKLDEIQETYESSTMKHFPPIYPTAIYLGLKLRGVK